MNALDRFATTRIKPLDGQPVLSLHCAIFLTTQQVIGDDSLRLVSFSGKEAISDHFEFELELHGNTSKRWQAPLSFGDVIGRPVTVGVQTATRNPAGHQPSREEASDWFQAALQGENPYPQLALFNGIVASFAIDRPGVYRLTMRPALWKLGLTNAYRVHAQCNVRDAIAQLLDAHHIEFSVAALVGSDNPAVTRVQDWLQAGETDEEFMRRLMGRAHIYFYFIHSARGHQVVFANRAAYPEALPGGHLLRYTDTEFEADALPQSDTLTRYSYKQSLVSGAVDTVITREEAAWEADAVASLHSYRAVSKPAGAALPFKQYQIVQYGGSDAEVDHLTHATQEALDASGREFSGASLCPHLRSGYRFGVTQQPRADQRPVVVRPELEGCSFVLTQVQHEATLDGSYKNEFTATDASSLVAAFSLRETQQGSVLGEVVAANATPPRADWRYGAPQNCDPESSTLADSTSSQPSLDARGVMVRLSTAPEGDSPVWIKLAAHMQTVPEVGTSVLVARAQDQTELPEIQSIIQSNVSQVIMPSGWTANTNVGSSYSTAYGDGKSIRFGQFSQADLDRAVGIVESKYRTGQFRETSFSQGASYSYATAENGAAGLLSTSDSLGSTYSTHEGKVSSSSTTFVDTDSISTVTGVASSTSNHASVINNSQTGQQTDTSVVGTSTHSSITSASAAMNLTGASANMSVTGASTSMNVVGMSADMNVVGTSTRSSITGASASTNVVGESNDMNVVGASAHLNVTGTSTGVSVTGATSDVSLVGTSSSVTIRSASTSVEITGSGISVQIFPGLLKVFMDGLDVTL